MLMRRPDMTMPLSSPAAGDPGSPPGHFPDRSSVGSGMVWFMIATLTDILVSVIVYPIASRALGPAWMGDSGVVLAVLNYFITAALLGVSVYGIREVARLGSDPVARSTVSLRLWLLGCGTSLVALLVYGILAVSVPAYRSKLPLFLAYAPAIPCMVLGLDWYFQGRSRFRYIALRTLVLKSLYALCVIVFVHSPDDGILYALLYSGMVFCAAAINHVLFLKDILHDLKGRVRGSLPPGMLTFAFYSIALNAVLNLDFIFLGFYSTPESAGLYSVAIRLCRLVLTLFAASSTVLLPVLASGRNGSDRLLTLSFSLTVMIAIPGAAAMFSLSRELVTLFGGPAFAASAQTLQILSLFLPVAAASAFFQMQVCIPRKKENRVLLALLAGILVSAFSLRILVPLWGGAGAALGVLSGELCILAILALDHESAVFLSTVRVSLFFKSVLAGAACGLGAWFCSLLPVPGFLRLLLGLLSGAGSGFSVFLALKDPIALTVLRSVPGLKTILNRTESK